jgi:hypothetical protein
LLFSTSPFDCMYVYGALGSALLSPMSSLSAMCQPMPSAMSSACQAAHYAVAREDTDPLAMGGYVVLRRGHFVRVLHVEDDDDDGGAKYVQRLDGDVSLQTGWCTPTALFHSSVPQWMLTMTLIKDQFVLQLVLNKSAGDSCRAMQPQHMVSPWALYDWPDGISFENKDSALTNGLRTRVHMTLNAVGFGWDMGNVEVFKEKLMLANISGAIVGHCSGEFVHGQYWYTTDRPLVIAPFHCRKRVESLPTDIHNYAQGLAYIDHGMMLDQLVALFTAIGYICSDVKYRLPSLHLLPYHLLHLTCDGAS